MRLKHLFALMAILLASINSFGQAVLTPRRLQRTQQADAPITPPHQEQTANAPLIPLPDALAVSAIKIKAKIEGQVATVNVEHLFRNDTDEALEGTYYFPVPEGATLLEFAVYDGDERRTGRVKEKEEARAAYLAGLEHGEDPAMLEMTRRGWFQSSVHLIPPHSDKRIELIYSQVLADKNGVIAFDYALGRGFKKLATPVGKVEIEVDLRSEVAIKNFFSPTHPLDIQYDGDRHATASIATIGGGKAENFQLLYSLSDEEIGMSLITSRQKGEDGYFLLMLSPKIDFDEKRVSAKDVIFVVDVSLSMEGEKIRQAKEAIRFGLTKTLNKEDRFNIIAFARDVLPMRQGMLRATPANIQSGLDFIEKLQLASATNINDALVTAMNMFEANGRLHNLVFLTDGQPNQSVTEPESIAANVRGANRSSARLFAFGVGSDVNHALLEKLAAENRGTGMAIIEQSQLSRDLSTFFSKVSQPVLSDLRVNFGPVIADRIHPAELPDLYTRSQIKIFGRYRNQEELRNVTVTLTGRMNEQLQRFEFSGLNFPFVTDDKGFLPKLWASERVSALLAEIRLSGERPELKQEVVDLARQFNLVTPYTSMYVPTTIEIEREKLNSSKEGADRASASQGKDSEPFSQLRLFADLKRNEHAANSAIAKGAGKPEAIMVTSQEPHIEATGAVTGAPPDAIVISSQDAQSMANSTRADATGSAKAINNLPINGRNAAQPPPTLQGSARPAQGAVVDASGAVIPNATVTIKDQNTGATRTVTTDADGNYSVAGLSPGTYEVQAQAPGFTTTTITNVVIQPDQPPAASVMLNTGTSSEAVTVTAVAQAIDVTTSHLSFSYQSKEIKELPSLAPVDLFARLASGVNASGIDDSPAQSARPIKPGEFKFSIIGGRPLSNGFTLNGHDNNGIEGGPAVSIKNFDAIEMLHVMTTRGTGDVSETGASSINLIIRGGTNEFHGSLFDYHLDRRLGALSPVERRSGLDRSPKFRNDIFGGTLGGPIRRDRMYFFGSLMRETEASRHFVDSTASSLTPTESGLTDLARLFPGSATVADLITRGPLARPIGDPKITRRFLLPVLGSNIEFGQIVRNIPSSATGYEAGARFDLQLTSRDHLQTGYWFESRKEINAAGQMAAGFAFDNDSQGQLGSLRWTRQLSPHSTNEMGISFNHTFASLDSNNDDSNDATGLKGRPDANIGLRGLHYGTGAFIPASYSSTLIEASETLSHIAGRHNLKIGGQVRGRLAEFNFLPGTHGQFNYASFDDFAQDAPASVAVAFGDPKSTFLTLHHHIFFDDAWRARSNLTLSFGLSYESAGQPYNQLVDRIRKREADPAQALFASGQPAPEHVDRDNNNIAPRIGFAFTPRFRLFGRNLFGYDKTVIRGGLSLSYDRTAFGPLAATATSAPNILLGVITPANAARMPAFPNPPDANALRSILGASAQSYATALLSSKYRTPSTLLWHFDISRDFDSKLTFALAYAGSRGAGLIRAIDGNPFSGGSTGAVRLFETSARSIYHSLQARADMRLTDRMTSSFAYTFSKLIDDTPEIVSAYGSNAGSVPAMLAPSLQSFAQSPFDNSRGERAVSSLDRRHSFSASFIWDLPLRRNQTRFLGRLLGGWKASAIIEAASGSPFSPVQFLGGSPASAALFASVFSDRLGAVRPFASNPGAPADAVAFSNAANAFFHFFANQDGTAFASPTGFIIADKSGFRAGSIASARFVYNDFAVEQAARARGLAPDAFGKTFAAGRPFGDVGRNTLLSPQLAMVNFALIKNTKLSERVSLQFRSEFFNLFNHPNRLRLNPVVENAGGFGFADTGEADASPRRIRLALKLIF